MNTESLGRGGFQLTACSAADRDRGIYKQLFYYCGPLAIKEKKNPKVFLSFYSCSAQYRKIRIT